jgi:hypothetical protein
MKKIFCLLLLGVMYVLTSSWANPVTSKDAKKTTADPYKECFVEESIFDIYSDCAGEMIRVTQTVNFCIVWIVNKNRNNSHVTIRRTGTGVGLTTGTQYMMNAHYHDVVNASQPERNNQFSFAVGERFDLIAPGRNNNLAVRYMAKYIVNANGEVIIDNFFGETTTTCR